MDGGIFMQWSRVGLASLLMGALLSVTGYASASGSDYSYSGMDMQPIPAGSAYGVAGPGVYHGFYHGCYRVRYHHGMKHHYVCPTYRAYYVCKKYTYEITPQHRDVACTAWSVKWKRVHHYWRHYSDNAWMSK
jgi:hypothetical protein